MIFLCVYHVQYLLAQCMTMFVCASDKIQSSPRFGVKSAEHRCPRLRRTSQVTSGENESWPSFI